MCFVIPSWFLNTGNPCRKTSIISQHAGKHRCYTGALGGNDNGNGDNSHNDTIDELQCEIDEKQKQIEARKQRK